MSRRWPWYPLRLLPLRIIRHLHVVLLLLLLPSLLLVPLFCRMYLLESFDRSHRLHRCVRSPHPACCRLHLFCFHRYFCHDQHIQITEALGHGVWIYCGSVCCCLHFLSACCRAHSLCARCRVCVRIYYCVCLSALRPVCLLCAWSA